VPPSTAPTLRNGDTLVPAHGFALTGGGQECPPYNKSCVVFDLFRHAVQEQRSSCAFAHLCLLLTVRMSLWLLPALLLLPTLAAQDYAIDQSTFNAGGTSANSQYSVTGTIGQPTAEVSSDENYALLAGFWNAINLPPSARAQSATTLEDTPVPITLAAVDAAADVLTYTITVPPAHGTLSGAPPILVYTPAADYHGADAFQFKATDNAGADSASAGVSVTIAAVNDAPLIDVVADQTGGYGNALVIPIAARDVDLLDSPADALTLAVSGLPEGLSFVQEPMPSGATHVNGKITGSPRGVGEYVITISATDRIGAPGARTFKLVVGKARLTFGALSKVREYGRANPPLDFTVTGFVGGAGIGELDSLPAVSTTATIASAVGVYPITLYGGTDNHYDYDFVNAFLTITTAPLTVAISAPAAGYVSSIGSAITFAGTFGYTGNPGKYQARWEFESSLSAWQAAGTVRTTESGHGNVSDVVQFDEPGVYWVTLTVTDGAGVIAEAASVGPDAAYVVIYHAAGGSISGGGWINSPPGAYLADPKLTGRATFNFNSKYQKGKSLPEGSTDLQFHAGKWTFKSSAYEWLVVAGPGAQCQGEGTISGGARCRFLLTVVDGDISGDKLDKLRIKIWDQLTGAIIYDNHLHADDHSSLPDTTVIGGGSIVIHK
jgi:hypothetical protein